MKISLREEYTHKLAFITEYGKFQPLRLNFGTKLSSTTCAHLMDLVLNKFDKQHVCHYIDDVIIASNNEQRMLQLIEQVLDTFIENN